MAVPPSAVAGYAKYGGKPPVLNYGGTAFGGTVPPYRTTPTEMLQPLQKRLSYTRGFLSRTNDKPILYSLVTSRCTCAHVHTHMCSMKIKLKNTSPEEVLLKMDVIDHNIVLKYHTTANDKKQKTMNSNEYDNSQQS